MRHYLSHSDMSAKEMVGLFGLADRIYAADLTDPEGVQRVVRDSAPRPTGAALLRFQFPFDKVMGVTFFEPSTRTRLSFSSAMLRLGGQVIGFDAGGGTSLAKGETLADTVRMMSAYCDLLVMRHPNDGAARLAAEYASVPVINAGDGGHEHPTQALMDLYAIRKHKGGWEGVTVGLVGDLLYGRTVHSLGPAAAALGAEVVLVSPPSLAMPEYAAEKVATAMGRAPRTAETLGEVIEGLDVIYMTRVQKERFPSEQAYAAVSGSYRLEARLMARAKPDCIVLHPLPRVTEIATEVDGDKRALYFVQAAYGVPVRMALACYVLAGGTERGAVKTPPTVERQEGRQLCTNPRCILNHERHVPEAAVEQEGERCLYCEQTRRN